MRIRRLVGVVALHGLVAGACFSDPADPNTWVKKLGNLREQKEALNQLSNMSVERSRSAVPALIALYKESLDPKHLEALARYRDDRAKPVMIEALSYTDDDFDRAVVAAGVLGELKAIDAVEPLIRATAVPLPVKSRANAAKLAALRALVKIGDKRAVPALVKILGTSADEQDFLLNQKAALGLAEFRDSSSVPALLKGLFMTGRGVNIFQECRLALVRVGKPAIGPLIELLNGQNADINAMARELQFDKFTPGVVPFKAAWVLGDLRAEEAVPHLLALLKKPEQGTERSSAIIALGQIATSKAVDALVTLARDAKAGPMLRARASDAIYLSGDARAVPTLLDIAAKGYVTVNGQKASDLRANAAINVARIAGPEYFQAFKALADKETEVQGKFGEALDRMLVAEECGTDLGCYGRTLGDASWTRAEKAAFAIGFSGQAKQGIPLLLGALKPLALMPQERYPVHQAILYSLVRLADNSCSACVAKLEAQIERDTKAIHLPGARDILGETRVALAIIQNKS
jgi:HEAT repeat protein